MAEDSDKKSSNDLPGTSSGPTVMPPVQVQPAGPTAGSAAQGILQSALARAPPASLGSAGPSSSTASTSQAGTHKREAPPQYHRADSSQEHADHGVDGEQHDNSYDGADGDEYGSGVEGDSKRPRLRLAHACDRCRRRKIRCDTQQPCAPCQNARSHCTFDSPSRRLVKKTDPSAPRKPAAARPISTQNLTLDQRLASIEALLRDAPRDSQTSVAIRDRLSKHLALGSSSAQSAAARPPVRSHSEKARASDPTAAAKGSATATEDDLDDIQRSMEGLNLSNGYLYLDEIGQTKWQGSTSGFPLLDILTASNPRPDSPRAASQSRPLQDPARALVPPSFQDSASKSHANLFTGASSTSPFSSDDAGEGPMRGRASQSGGRDQGSGASASRERFFPGRMPRPSQMLNPEASWRVITNVIPSDLMDTLVRCYLSTSHLLWPFLHTPTFLKDYANPQKWAEPGFACFVVAVCTLSSRHVDDPRVRSKSSDASTAGKSYYELFKRLRDLPSADRPTLYSIQAVFLAAIYAFGLGTLSKAFSLMAESVTLCLDGGLHRSVDSYEFFNPIERETRKRTFWSIYAWDKQSAALFGRPPLIHLRDCDVTEPLQIDDDYLTATAILNQPVGHQSRLSAFVAVIRLHVVLEGVIDSCVRPSAFLGSSFLSEAAAVISKRSPRSDSLVEEEALLTRWVNGLDKHWRYDAETVESRDPIRITQAERLHCLEHLIRMIIYRHRFSGFVQVPATTAAEKARHLECCKQAMTSALTICANHVHISQRGMMTYYGVHVIHQLAQAGRTLVAVILASKEPEFKPLVPASIEGLRSCVGLLRRFSGRYVCGLRSADIIDEFCRICNIPIETPLSAIVDGKPSPAWLRPLQRRRSPSPATKRTPTGSQQTETPPESKMTPAPAPLPSNGDLQDLNQLFADALDNPVSANALLSTQDFFDLSAAASPAGFGSGSTPALGNSSNGYGGSTNSTAFNPPPNNDFLGFDALGPASAPYDQFESLAPDAMMIDNNLNTYNGADLGSNWDGSLNLGNDPSGQLSASAILQLMQEGTFTSAWS